MRRFKTLIIYSLKCSLVTQIVFVASSFAGGAKKPQDPSDATRSLRKVIALDRITAKPILSNGQEVFDFENAINQQAYTAAVATGKFTVKLQDPIIALKKSGFRNLDLNDDEKCLASLPALRITGEVLGFEIESTTGLHAGFSPKVDFDIGAHLSQDIVKTQMNAVFFAKDPTGKSILHSVNTNQVQQETKTGVTVDFSNIANLDHESYSKTPLAVVVAKSLNTGFNSIAAATETLLWEAPVMVVDNDFIAINAGFDAGVKVGDEFKVQNRIHYWQGEPCQSEYLGSRPDPDPTAYVQVYDVQSTLSWAKVTRWTEVGSPIFPGARVQVEKLAP